MTLDPVMLLDTVEKLVAGPPPQQPPHPPDPGVADAIPDIELDPPEPPGFACQAPPPPPPPTVIV